MAEAGLGAFGKNLLGENLWANAVGKNLWGKTFGQKLFWQQTLRNTCGQTFGENLPSFHPP